MDIEQEKQGAQNGSLVDTTADSLRREALTVKLNELQPVGEVDFCAWIHSKKTKLRNKILAYKYSNIDTPV